MIYLVLVRVINEVPVLVQPQLELNVKKLQIQTHPGMFNVFLQKQNLCVKRSFCSSPLFSTEQEHGLVLSLRNITISPGENHYTLKANVCLASSVFLLVI